MPPLRHRRAGERESMIERRNQVWELRKMGLSSRRIAEQVHVSYQTVLEDIDWVFEQLNRDTVESADEWRNLELERLDSLQVPMWQLAMGRAAVPAKDGQPAQKAVRPNIRAAQTILRISIQRAKLLGLYKNNSRIDIIFIREIIRMIEQRGGDPMSVFRSLAETLEESPVMIEAENDEGYE